MFVQICKDTLYTGKQPLAMAYERSESARENLGKLILTWNQDIYRENWKDLN